MTTTLPPPSEELSLRQVGQELSRQLEGVKEPGEAPVQLARLSNLVIFCSSSEQLETIALQVPDIVALHPARVLLAVGEPAGESGKVTASVTTWCRRGHGGVHICSEQVTLRAQGDTVAHLPFAVRGLLIGDLPTNLWWAANQPPALAGAFLYDLAEQAQQIIYDSIAWMEPAKGVAATASWLTRFERGPGQGAWRVASDLNWRRLKYWRRLLGQALDPASAPGALESITDVLVEHGPHAVVQAWELVSWLAARLGWRVQGGRVQPNVEIAWHCQAAHGSVRVRIDRLAEGPSEIRRVRIACALGGKPAALNVAADDDRRLAVVPEGIDGSPRTITVQPQSLAALVGRQLSDRERDPVFRESMMVAQIFARSVLGQ
jgi:glucose-6-phosphate dehydrogenase assembly protein OpcA